MSRSCARADWAAPAMSDSTTQLGIHPGKRHDVVQCRTPRHPQRPPCSGHHTRAIGCNAPVAGLLLRLSTASEFLAESLVDSPYAEAKTLSLEDGGGLAYAGGSACSRMPLHEVQGTKFLASTSKFWKACRARLEATASTAHRRLCAQAQVTLDTIRMPR